MGLCHLVQDIDPLAALGRIFQRQLQATNGVLDVNEGSRLAAGPMHRQRMVDGRLHHEPVQHRAVIPIVIEAVDQALVELRLFRLGAPDDALVQVG